ncbi:MAG TPA: hypothetical protein P5298_05580 [Spirochaetia bacterium]|nr:hypothetical protein [Spirochaetales bacterium]HRW23858.1 hypothetical protein [Spirochaetia bacterium]
MPDAIAPVAWLLAPVVALLFVALRLRRRLVYPHELLADRSGARPTALLLRTIRLYYDAALDAACAVVVGLAIAGYPRPAADKGPAVVIDASASMLAGLRGDRPLDEAARLALTRYRLDEPGARRTRLFALGWDPARRRHTLTDRSDVLEAARSPQELAAGLESSESFMSADYALLKGLARRGYGEIRLLTDDASVEGLGVEIVRLPAKPPRYLLLAKAAWDRGSGRSVARFVSAGGAEPDSLWRLGADGAATRAKPEDFEIRRSPSGFELALAIPGAWAVRWDGRLLPFIAPGPPEPLRARGTMAERVVAGLPRLVAGNTGGAAGARPSGGWTGRGVELTDRGGTGRPGSLSVAEARDESWLLPPRLTLGALVASGLDRRADLALGPAAFASAEAATPFWLAWASSAAPDGRAAMAAASRPMRVGDGYLYPGEAVVTPPPGEYAPTGRRVVAAAGSPPERRAVVALALALLYCLKAWLGLRRRRGA